MANTFTPCPGEQIGMNLFFCDLLGMRSHRKDSEKGRFTPGISSLRETTKRDVKSGFAHRRWKLT